MTKRDSHDIAIIGIGCRFPGANDLRAYWNNIVEGRSSFADVPPDRWDHRAFFSTSQREVDKTWTPKGAFIDDIRSFSALHYGIAPRRLEVMDPQHRLLIEATRVALQDSGYETRSFDRRRTGVFAGLAVAEWKNLALGRISAMQLAAGQFGPAAGSSELRDAVLEMAKHTVPLRAFSIAGSLTNMAAASIAQTFDLSGPAYSIDAACAAGAVAIYDAILHLRAGLLDLAVAGGAYLNLTPDNLIGFARVGAISPTGTCRPFDHRADGFVQGDGVGMLLLKRLCDAVHDNDYIHAVIRGVACNNDARGEGPMTPRVEGQLGVLEAAYSDARVSPASISYFEAHGTATRVGDPVEIEALGRVLKESGVTEKNAPLIGSVKGNVGHTMSAAGVAAILKAVRLVDSGIAPPLAGFEAPHPALHADRWPLRMEGTMSEMAPRDSDGVRAGVSVFGFGGTNVHFVVEQSPERHARGRRRAVVRKALPEAVVLSAPTLGHLAAFMRDMSKAVLALGSHGVSLSEIAWTLNATREFERFRAVVCAVDLEDLALTLLDGARALDARAHAPSPSSRLTPKISVFEAKAETPKICFLFPGQGAQRVGMLTDIRERFSVFKEAFSILERDCLDVTERPLSSFVWPTLRTEDSAAQAQAEFELKQTENCQPVMAALGLSLAALFEDTGVFAHVSLGHSLGEFVAIANGGILSSRDAVRLVAQRGREMARLKLADAGAMAAVMASADEVHSTISGIDGVWLANLNHPGQVAISGTTLGVKAACERLTKRGFNVQSLRVSHAFHSPLLLPMQTAMASLSEGLVFKTPRHVVASCISADVHDGAEATKEIVLEHSTAPVDFVSGLRRARDNGANIFVQVGAGNILTAFARATFHDHAVETLSCASLEGDGGLEFVRCLATLSALGVPVRFDAVIPLESRNIIDLPTTPLEREEYWVIKSEAQIRPRLDHPIPGPTEGFGIVETHMTKRQLDEIAGASAQPHGTETSESTPSNLIRLLEEQASILRRHAEIIHQQNQLLLGHEAVSIAPSHETRVFVPKEDAAAAATDEACDEDATEAPAVDILRTVYEIVAKVSAFPRESLRGSQRLVDDLGFDSLMVADLIKAIDATFPSQGGLPQTLFRTDTTLDDVTKQVEKSLAKIAVRGEAPRTPKADDTRTTKSQPDVPTASDSPLLAYEIRLSEQQLRRPLAPARFDGRTWLLVEGEDRLGDALSSALSSSGAKVVRVKLSNEAIREPERFWSDARHLWPISNAHHLVSAVEREGGSLGGVLFVAAPHDSNGLFALHALAQKLRDSPLVVVTQLGGSLGLVPDERTSGAPIDGAYFGYMKALAQERHHQTIRAIDVDPSEDRVSLADDIVQEILSGDRQVEMGLRAHKRWVSTLVPAERTQDNLHLAFTENDVALILGGAGDLGSQVARALSTRRLRGLVLMGRTPTNSKTQALEREISALGTPTRYVAGDASNGSAWLTVVQEAERVFGAITVCVHAAGLIEDSIVEKKSAESFRRVFDAKVAPLAHVQTALPNLGLLVLFGSWAGRFGNRGQTDYSAANEVLARYATQGLGAAKVVTLEWPPWTDSQMARSIPEVMKRTLTDRGVPFVSTSEGIALMNSVLASGQRGLWVAGRAPLRRPVRFGQRLEISTATMPYLDDHRLKGVPVLPLAGATDLLLGAVRAATANTVDPNTHAIEDLELVHGVIVQGPQEVLIVVDGEIRESAFWGTAEIYVQKKGEKPIRAYRAKIGPAHRGTNTTRNALVGTHVDPPFDVATFYAQHTFHGPRLQPISRLERMTNQGIIGWVRPSVRSALVNGLGTEPWAIDPVVLDGAFQLAGFWAFAEHQVSGYPIGFRRLVVHRPFDNNEVRCTIVLTQSEAGRFVGDIRFDDAEGVEIAAIFGLQGRFVEGTPFGRAQTVPTPPSTAAKPMESIASSGSANGSKGTEPKALQVNLQPERWSIEHFPEVEALVQRLKMAELVGLKNPYFSVHSGTARNRSVVEGVEMTNFSSYNYLGFSGHPEVVRAAQEAIARYGTSVSASRVASGERPIHRELERGIAEHIGVEDAIVFVSGHATNVTTIGTIVGPEDIVFHDSLIHESIMAGIRQSGATRRPYPHGNLDALERVLGQIRSSHRRALIVGEGVYSMDGDICDLPRLIAIKKKYQALLMIDEAHSIGVLGPSGRGVAHHFSGIDPNDVDLWMGTLSKSFASCGGYIAGTGALVTFLKYSAGGFVYSAGITPPNCAAAIKSLELMRSHPDIVQRLHANSRLFLEAARAHGLDTGLAAGYAVVPVIVGNSLHALKLSAALLGRRINVNPIVYPAVEDDAARLRFFISATHTEQELLGAAAACAEELARIRHEDGAGEAMTL